MNNSCGKIQQHSSKRSVSAMRRLLSLSLQLTVGLAIALVLAGVVEVSAQAVTDPATGKQYQIVAKSCTWPFAADSAFKMGGQLASITSAEEQAFVYAAFRNSYLESYFIGGTDSLVEGKWEWISGEPWVFTNWISGEPNNADNEDFAAMYFGFGGRWNDVRRTTALNGFIAEFDRTEYPVARNINCGDPESAGASGSVPQFNWHFLDTLPGVQQGVEIEVGNDTDWVVAEQWQSGQIITGDTSMVYGGSPLQDNTTYVLRIRVFNGTVWGGWTKFMFHVDFSTLIYVPGTFATLAEAIATCGNSDTIVVMPGCYEIAETSITDRVVIRSAEGPNETILMPKAATSGYLFRLQAGARLSLSGMTMRGSSDVGQIYAPSASLELMGMSFERLKIKANLISLTGASRCQISRCTFSNLQTTGNLIFADIYTELTFVNNTVDSVTTNALYIANAASVIKNNIFQYCTVAISNYTGSEETYNCFWQNGQDRYPDAPIGPGSLALDPLLPSRHLGSFILDSASPCLDSGDPSSDFYDPDGSRSDMGAVPYSAEGIFLADLLFNGISGNSHVIPGDLTIDWSYVRAEDRARQTGFEIELHEGPCPTSPLWQRTSAPSTDTAMMYDGPALQRGQTYGVRIRVSDGAIWSPWYYAMIRVNSAPPLPTLEWPPPGAIVADSQYQLYWSLQPDPDGDGVRFDVEVYADSALTQLARYVYDLWETTWKPALRWENKAFFIRLRSTDRWEYSDWTEVRKYYINCREEVPPTGAPLSPRNPAVPLYTVRPTCVWNRSVDPDPLDTVRYLIQIASDTGFVVKYEEWVSQTTFALPEDLVYGDQYWWRTRAMDKTGRSALSVTASFRIYALGDLTNDFSTDISDLTRMVSYLFIEMQPLNPMNIGDLNDDCSVDILDLTILIDHLFVSYTPLKPGCAIQPTE